MIQAANDERKQTGQGWMKPLSEFNLMCLELVKAAKGKAAVEYIHSVPEPSATNIPTKKKTQINKAIVNPMIPVKPTSETKTASEIKTVSGTSKKPEKRRLIGKRLDIFFFTSGTIFDFVRVIESSSFCLVDDSELCKTSSSKKGKKTENKSEEIDSWKRDLFAKFHSIEEAKHNEQADILLLKKYNLVLRNIKLEQELCKQINNLFMIIIIKNFNKHMKLKTFFSSVGLCSDITHPV